MIGIYIALGGMVVALVFMAKAIGRLKNKLQDAIFLKKEGDRLLFKDYEGKTISEKIKIEFK